MKSLKFKLRSEIKWLYYALTKASRGLLVPKQYRFEYKFFEGIRGCTYSDLTFREAKLRNKAHQLDKTLTFKEFKKKGTMARSIADLAQEISNEPDHDPSVIRWCNNILSEYKYRTEGTPQSKKAPLFGFDVQTHELLRGIIESRRSIRSFKPDPINREILNKILNAGLWAPSSCNRQTVEYLVLEEKADTKYCQRLAGEGYSFPQEAALNVVVLIDPRSYALPMQRHMAFLEGGAAVQNILLTAYSLGIGSCWLFWGNDDINHTKFVKKFSLKPWLLPVAMVCLGYPGSVPKFYPDRKDLARCIHFPNPSQNKIRKICDDTLCPTMPSTRGCRGKGEASARSLPLV